MFLNVLIGSVMMVVTTAIHAAGMTLALQAIRGKAAEPRKRHERLNIYWLGRIVVLMFLVSLVEVAAWVAVYLGLGAIQGVEKAAYFSMVTFSTLGYGDIVLDQSWRLLASFQAANGTIMFGWTTAMVIAAVQHLHFGQEVRHPQPRQGPREAGG